MIASELEAWMLRAKPGETVEYWRGRLASNREYMGTYLGSTRSLEESWS